MLRVIFRMTKAILGYQQIKELYSGTRKSILFIYIFRRVLANDFIPRRPFSLSYIYFRFILSCFILFCFFFSSLVSSIIKIIVFANVIGNCHEHFLFFFRIRFLYAVVVFLFHFYLHYFWRFVCCVSLISFLSLAYTRPPTWNSWQRAKEIMWKEKIKRNSKNAFITHIPLLLLLFAFDAFAPLLPPSIHRW